MVEENLPVLPVGVVLRSSGFLDREVIRSAPGFVLVVDGREQIAMAWINGAWRARPTGAAWTVKPEPVEFIVRKSTSTGSWVVSLPADVGVSFFSISHPDAEGAARAEAARLNGMTNKVQP